MWKSIKQYLGNCNLHGTRYLVEDGRHWTERLFWLIFCALSWWGCATMVMGVLEDFNERPVAFTIETSYLDWQTEFPSISVCVSSTLGVKRVVKEIYQAYGIKITSEPVRQLLTNMGVLTRREHILASLTSENLIHLYQMAIDNCTELFSECNWNGKKFECCDEFQPLQTTAGYCYLLNSRHIKRRDASPVNFISNRTTGIGRLFIDFKDFAVESASSVDRNIKVYFHNNLEIPLTISNSDKEIIVRKRTITNVGFSVQDTYNEAGLHNVSPKKRNCRFSHENDDISLYALYSNDVCVTQMQVERMLLLCSCVSHTYPRLDGMPVCNHTQLMCMKKEKSKIVDKISMKERCLPDCEGIVIRHYKQNDYDETPVFVNDSEQSLQGIRVQLYSLPSVRYRRYVVRSLLDVIVAVGSAAGLFMGASILSVIEVIYWLLLRHG